jgi:glycosyltransferase involved in cell wall biosynthesis
MKMQNRTTADRDPRISVLMPCYNAEATLAETLTSLAEQTWQDYEIIAVDDGSTDGTADILSDWAGRDARLIVKSIAHMGIVMALNVGLDTCSGVYVARMDADDCAHPERLARQAALLDENPDIGVASCLVRGFPVENVRGGFRVYMDWLNSLVKDEQIRREMFVESPIPHPSVMARREVLLAAGGYHERGWAEDYDLWLRLYLAGVRFEKAPEILLDWREHPDRLTRVDGRYSLENFLRAKAHYLARGPLQGRDAVIVWGAGMMGRRLGKQLARCAAPLVAHVDVDVKKIGKTLRGLPIISRDELPEWWSCYQNPVVVTAVGARGSRPLIREYLESLDLKEGQDWWSAA